jgi:hypothetical protein
VLILSTLPAAVAMFPDTHDGLGQHDVPFSASRHGEFCSTGLQQSSLLLQQELCCGAWFCFS